MRRVLRARELAELGYRQLGSGGLIWWVDERGRDLVAGVKQWSPQGLAFTGWTFWDKGSHGLYLTAGKEGERFLVKLYGGSGGGPWGRDSKARREFHNTLLAYRKGFRTVLPVAWGEPQGAGTRAAIAYPFMDGAVSLERVYHYRERSGLSAREKHDFERQVGLLLRHSLDSGLFPVNMCLGHFLGLRDERSGWVVYWVDFEKVKWRVGFRRRQLIRNLGKLLARMEWFRASGGKMGRPSIMRIAYPILCREDMGKADKSLCWQIIAAAQEYWKLRQIHERGAYPVNQLEPVGRKAG